MKRIFVYGTLLRGERNHHLLASSRFVDEARTAPGFELRDLGEFPAMLRGGTGWVTGELYLVGPEALAALDELEVHPDFFVRTPVVLDSGDEAEAYLLPNERAQGRPRIEGGSWRERGA